MDHRRWSIVVQIEIRRISVASNELLWQETRPQARKAELDPRLVEEQGERVTSPAPPRRNRHLTEAGWDRFPKKKDLAAEADYTPLCVGSCVVYVEREELELQELPRTEGPPSDLSRKDRHVEAERD